MSDVFALVLVLAGLVGGLFVAAPLSMDSSVSDAQAATHR